jgi:protein-S-isoprenylcysteine O-methyltransferase Ste14
MSDLHKRAVGGLLGLFLSLATLLFGAAGTFDYWQGWAYLAAFIGMSIAATVDLARRDPNLLARRSSGGPFAEGTTTQKIIMSLAMAGFVALLVVPALDRRFGWSAMPTSVAVIGDVLFVLSYLAIMYVFRVNTFAASTIAVEPDQTVVTTGPYAIVRHPMYASGLVLLMASPVALGSWWGLLLFIPLVPILAWRLLDEEQYLRANLPGYSVYCERVRYRLFPYVW